MRVLAPVLVQVLRQTWRRRGIEQEMSHANAPTITRMMNGTSQRYFGSLMGLSVSATHNKPEMPSLVVLVDPRDPSNTCSKCGHSFEFLSLADRWIDCACGLSLDRGHNATINIQPRRAAPLGHKLARRQVAPGSRRVLTCAECHLPLFDAPILWALCLKQAYSTVVGMALAVAQRPSSNGVRDLQQHLLRISCEERFRHPRMVTSRFIALPGWLGFTHQIAHFRLVVERRSRRSCKVSSMFDLNALLLALFVMLAACSMPAPSPAPTVTSAPAPTSAPLPTAARAHTRARPSAGCTTAARSDQSRHGHANADRAH